LSFYREPKAVVNSNLSRGVIFTSVTPSIVSRTIEGPALRRVSYVATFEILEAKTVLEFSKNGLDKGFYPSNEA
jgi:hypothetical protein